MEKLSTTLAERRRETEHEIGALHARLQAIATEKQTVLGAATVDTKLLQKLEVEEQRLPTQIDSQQTRLTLLVSQIEEAEKEEAALRIAAIENEHQTLACSLEAKHQEWLAGLDRLATLFTEAATEKARLQLLADESHYLVERYGVRRAHLRAVAGPAPADIDRKLEEGFRRQRWSLHRTSVWKERADEIRTQKNEAARVAEEEQRQRGHSRIVRMSVPDFTPGMKG